jgi:molecular chaperone DnaK (HSP70)
MELSDMEAVFEPVVERVIELVRDQIASTNVGVKAVLLVGGFGQSSYLKERLRTSLAKINQEIEVLQPPDAWTAVVRGAVMKGLANHDDKLAAVHIGPRAARKHYGFICTRNFNADKHRENSK